MTDDQISGSPQRRTRDIVRDAIVMVSMTFVALAVGFGLHLQLGFTFWTAALAATATYFAMLFSHLMLSQNRQTSQLHSELVRLRLELAELQRKPAEGGVLREAPGSGSAGAGHPQSGSQSYGYGRGHQPEVTVPLASQSPQIEMRPRPIAPHGEMRLAAKAQSSIDDAADLLADLGSLAEPVPPAKLRQPITPVLPVLPPVQPLVQAPVQVQAVMPVIVTPKPVPPQVTAAALAEAMPLARPVAKPTTNVELQPESKPVIAKRIVPTEGDRDVEAIHDLIKKLAADIVGGQTVSPTGAAHSAGATTPVRIAMLPDRITEKAVELKPAATKPMPASAPSLNRHVSSGRVPVAAPRAIVKPNDAPDLAQALAEHLDTMPPLRNEPAPTTVAATLAATVAAPVAIAAVVAARTAVEARLAVKAAPAIVPQAPAVDVTAPARLEPPVLPVVATVQVEPDAETDADDLADIGAQLAAELGAGHHHEPTLDLHVDALKSAVDAMRAQPTVAALAAALDHAPRYAAYAADTESATRDPVLREKLELISSALDEDRFDVCLEAIIGLDDRRAQHYEVTVRLKDIDDDVRQVAVGSGLLPLLDAAIIDQSARIAWKLEDRGKPGSLFSQITGESLESDRFLNRFADTYRHSETVASRLVLAFTQSDLRGFTGAHWATLRDMADLGFRFSLEDLTDLDLDFLALKDAGFAFVKLDAAVFLGGLPVASGIVPAAHICSHFEQSGLVVIVGRIGDEDQYEQVLDSGVGLGQGELFGIARPVKSDVLKTQQRAVA